MELSPSERAGEALEASHAEHNSQVWFNLKLCFHLGIWVGILAQGWTSFIQPTSLKHMLGLVSPWPGAEHGQDRSLSFRNLKASREEKKPYIYWFSLWGDRNFE